MLRWTNECSDPSQSFVFYWRALGPHPPPPCDTSPFRKEEEMCRNNWVYGRGRKFLPVSRRPSLTVTIVKQSFLFDCVNLNRTTGTLLGHLKQILHKSLKSFLSNLSGKVWDHQKVSQQLNEHQTFIDAPRSRKVSPERRDQYTLSVYNKKENEWLQQ